MLSHVFSFFCLFPHFDEPYPLVVLWERGVWKVNLGDLECLWCFSFTLTPNWYFIWNSREEITLHQYLRLFLHSYVAFDFVIQRFWNILMMFLCNFLPGCSEMPHSYVWHGMNLSFSMLGSQWASNLRTSFSSGKFSWIASLTSFLFSFFQFWHSYFDVGICGPFLFLYFHFVFFFPV